jgi:hypothetical protein
MVFIVFVAVAVVCEWENEWQKIVSPFGPPRCFVRMHRFPMTARGAEGVATMRLRRFLELPRQSCTGEPRRLFGRYGGDGLADTAATVWPIRRLLADTAAFGRYGGLADTVTWPRRRRGQYDGVADTAAACWLIRQRGRYRYG